jgi:hypothetical protein
MKIRRNQDGSIMIGSLRISRGGFVIIGLMATLAVYVLLAIQYGE